jgi:hypothetical protein
MSSLAREITLELALWGKSPHPLKRVVFILCPSDSKALPCAALSGRPLGQELSRVRLTHLVGQRPTRLEQPRLHVLLEVRRPSVSGNTHF